MLLKLIQKVKNSPRRNLSVERVLCCCLATLRHMWPSRFSTYFKHFDGNLPNILRTAPYLPMLPHPYHRLLTISLKYQQVTYDKDGQNTVQKFVCKRHRSFPFEAIHSLLTCPDLRININCNYV